MMNGTALTRLTVQIMIDPNLILITLTLLTIGLGLLAHLIDTNKLMKEFYYEICNDPKE